MEQNKFLHMRYSELNQDKTPHKKIKNNRYRQFLDEGIISTLTEADIEQALSNVTGKWTQEARAMIICLYYTGARPNEVLQLKAKDIFKQERYVLIKMKGSKGGLPRTIYLPHAKPLVQELLEFACSLFDEQIMFWHFKNIYRRRHITKKGRVIERNEVSDKLRYHFQKWFGDNDKGNLPPYFLRHNRFSKLAEKGVAMQELRMIKGSRSFESVLAYLHLSEESAKKVSKMMD